MKTPILLATLAACAAPCVAEEAASGKANGDAGYAQYEIDTSVRLMTDRRTHGISDSFRGPAAELHIEAAHASGLVGVVELGTVSKHVYLDGDGYNALVAGGYRWGDPDRFHFGLGLAREFFPGAHFQAPSQIALTPDGIQALNLNDYGFDSSYAVIEFAYGAVEARLLDVISDSFRGMNTGLVCGTMLQVDADPTAGLDCYARGDHGSRGSQLLDVDFHHELPGGFTLLVHGGIQQVNHFSEADSWDWKLGIERKQWGLDWKLEGVGAHAHHDEVYTAEDGSGRVRTLLNTAVMLTAEKTF